MEEFILKIKELKQIEPEKGWIKTTKNHIMGQIEKEPFFFNLNFGWLTNNLSLAAPVFLALFVIGALFFYNKNIFYTQIALNDLGRLEQIRNSLQMAESDIIKTTNNLERVGEAERVLRVKEMINSAIENGDKVVEATRKMVGIPVRDETPEVFTTISGVEYAAQNLEYALEDMEEAYLEKQKEMARNLIEELEAKSLSEEQKIILEQAKEDYNEGRFDEALEKAIGASQTY